METYTYDQCCESARALQARLGGFCPKVLLILGSGLGSLADAVEDPIAVPYDQVPHMKRSTAPDHAGRFVFGRLARNGRGRHARAGCTPTRAGPTPT